MGHQFGFYLNSQDQANMNDVIFREFVDIVVLKDDMEKQYLEFLDTTEFKLYNGEDIRVYLTRNEFLGQIIIDPPRKMVVPPFKIRNILNQDQSPIVEYWRCVIISDQVSQPVIRRGRLYYIPEFYSSNNNGKIYKDPNFVSFAQRLFTLFKKNLIYRKENGSYYGEGALLDEKNGWVLAA